MYEPVLTQTEYIVASLVAKGLSNERIAQTLSIKCATVENHCRSIYGKLNLKRRSQLPMLFATQPPKYKKRSDSYKAAIAAEFKSPTTVSVVVSLIGCSPSTAYKCLKENNLLKKTYDTRAIIHEGEALTVLELSRESGIPAHVLRNRIIVRKWDVTRAMSTPVRVYRSKSDRQPI